MTRFLFSISVVILFMSCMTSALALPTDPSAQDPSGESAAEPVAYPDHRLTYSNLLVIRGNPRGAQNDFKLTYRNSLYGAEDKGVLFKDCEWVAGSTLLLTPAFLRTGGLAAIRPLAILYLEARMEWIASFGTFGHISGFPGPDSNASDAIMEARAEEGGLVTTGLMSTLKVELRAKVGPIVPRSTLSFYHTKMKLNPEDRVFYEGNNDLLLSKNGWSLHNDADLLWMGEDGWVAGIRHTLDLALFDLPEESAVARGANQRIGPLVAYSFFDDPGAAFNKPTLVLILNWYLEHPYRNGQEVHRGVPYTLVAFAFGGDLLGNSP